MISNSMQVKILALKTAAKSHRRSQSHEKVGKQFRLLQEGHWSCNELSCESGNALRKITKVVKEDVL